MDTQVQDILDQIDDTLRARLLTLRRWLHQHPELSFHEVETAIRISDELEHLGIPTSYEGEGHALIARIDGRDPTRQAIALRAEMDALPGDETTGAPYASVYPGRMHACGHGAHMAMLIGAASLLNENPPPGPVQLVFQPAEELGGGARIAIEDGALDDVAAIFAGHVTHEYETGKIMIRDGPVTAQSDRFTVRVRGKGGHGARPHEAVDAVVISGFLIAALQTLVSREINPLHPSVVTIGKVSAGSAANVIAEQAEMYGSIRTLNNEVRANIHKGLKRMIAATAELHSAEINIDIEEGYPPVINEPVTVSVAREAAADIVGESAVVAAEFPSMGSEDFSYYQEKVRGCFVRFGARHPDWEPIPLHSPAFDVDERVLGIGTRFFDRLARVGHAHMNRLSNGL
ncbi:MAG: M20 family metallopeptidase [Gammaproteobacteria bacterium]|nr:M20 family metallopeptidase [Gammaproteobacteria bacterium]